MKIPKSLAKVADMYKQARDARLAMQKKVDELQSKEVELKNYLIDNLPKSQAGGVQGAIARVEIVKKNHPYIEDREKFFKYAAKHRDLVVEQLNAAAVKERWDANKVVPGVGKHVVVTLSLHSVKH